MSESARRVVVETDRVAPGRVRVVPNGYDWDRICSTPEAARSIRLEFDVGDDLLLCTVGRFDALKGHEVLLHALASPCVPAHSRLLIVGEGPSESSLRQLARTLGLADRCIFAGFRSDVYNVMAAADLIVHPSLSEAQCQVLIEALALARPVVATKVGAASELLIPGKTGWLVPPRDPTALATAISEALQDPTRAHRYGCAGRARVRAMYPIERMLAAYEEVYRRLLGRLQ